MSVHTGNSAEIARSNDIFTQAEAEDICTTGEASTPKDSKSTQYTRNPAEETYAGAPL